MELRLEERIAAYRAGMTKRHPASREIRGQADRGVLDDVQRLEDFLFELALEPGDFVLSQRAMNRHSRRRSTRPRDQPVHLAHGGNHSTQERELLIPFGSAGYVALFHSTGRVSSSRPCDISAKTPDY